MGKSVQVHKSHKTRFASKASRNIHRTSQTDKARISKEKKHQVGGKGSRTARIQRNKMARDQKRSALLKEKRALGGPSSPPRVIVLVEHDNDIDGQCNLLLSGYVRAHSFSLNHLVHVSGAGDFQLSRIDVLMDPIPLNPRKNSDYMVSDGCHCEVVLHSLLSNPLKLDPLIVENLPDPLAGEQTWPTESEMVEADNLNERRKLKKKILPQGTSDYQAAWIVDDTDEEDFNADEDEDGGEGMVLDDGKNAF